MPQPPSLLLITWNRSEYLRRTVQTLLADPADFRLYCWDNASEDGARDLIADLKDERVVERHFSPENVNQARPVRWFLDRAPDGLVGKVDDDILLPTRWTERLSEVLSSSDRFGMLGCWIYMPEDYDCTSAQHNEVVEGGKRVLRSTSIAGHSFLAQRRVLQRYLMRQAKDWGIPIDRTRMTLDGMISGYPLPLVTAHNMDDPRSEHCLMTAAGINAPGAALTARSLGFTSLAEYAAWIRRDALRRQVIPYSEQVTALRRREFRGTGIGRLLNQAERMAMRMRRT